MQKNEILIVFLTSLVVFLSVSCAHREGDPDARVNPYDAGSGDWTKNASPVINVSSDSLWYDFNHSKVTGTVKIKVEEDDLNFPYDTLVSSVFYNGTEIKLPRLSSKKGTALLLSGIKPDTAAQCTVIVYDSKQSVSSMVFSITVPDSFPAIPPSASVLNSSQNVILSWPKAPNTNYVIYYSDSLKGPYSGSISVPQSNSSTISVYNQLSGYLPRYYIVATKNKFGTAYSTDTLIGRRYYSGISTPSISSISQGTFSTYIALSVYNYSYDLDYMEIYRSTNDTSAFRLVKKVKTTSNSYLYFNDSVQTSATYYYRINAIDKQGRCSFPSSARYGYLQRLYAPTLYINSYPDYLNLSWTTVTGAAKFRVYRSSLNCMDSLKLLSETSELSYNDTPPTGKIYYYKISAVADNGLEGSRSSCIQGKMTILPQPDSIVVTTNYFPKHIALAWRKVEGADGYIVYRSNYNSYSDTLPIDTISNNTYNDSLPDYSFRYYRIAAFNSKGVGVLSSKYMGSIISPVFSNYLSKNDSVFLTFTKNNRAIKYFIYRSSNQNDFTLIDSTTTPSYAAPLKDFSTWYYRFTIQVPEGVSYPSATVSIVRQLSIPYNIKTTSLTAGVRIEWSKIIGAEKYDIYRSTSSSSNLFYRSTSDTFFIDTLPEGSPLYYYSLRSVNTSTTSQLSSKYQARRLSPPETPTFIVTIGQLKAIYLSWGMPTSSSIPDGFAIYRSTDNATFSLIDSTKNDFYYDSISDTSIYYYRLSSFNTLGESPLSQTYSARILRPSAPQNLSGTLATSKTYIRITWSQVSSVTKYSIYRATTPNGIFENIGSVSNTNIFYDSTCNVNTTYYYKAASISPENQSSPLSSYTSGIRLGPPDIATINKYDNGVMIWWNPHSYSIQYYNVYRAATISGPYTKIDNTTKYNYRDSTGTLNSYYKISAVNTIESDLSNARTISISIPTISVVASQGTKTDLIDISWTPVSGAISYRIYRAPTDSFNRNITRITTITSTTYTDYVIADSIYFYKITVLTPGDGESGFSTQTAFGYRYPTTKPLPITEAYSSSGNDNISLSWNKPPTSVGYNKYSIYRSTSSDGPFELIASTTETIYKDIPPQKSPTVYSYYITSVNQMGESTPSGLFSGGLTP